MEPEREQPPYRALIASIVSGQGVVRGQVAVRLSSALSSKKASAQHVVGMYSVVNE